ncbi:unnamed protein product [Acanthoscelides obtectus]|uniref:Ig-like domain-containing protein n=1 Tax=Acanthoscelides obtectus TaxID=200917 RepID=A0A9P0L358_ACAOB|nr:unnamed protein product [Acanthoscelides obtectus]CAK1646884.1 hypothetical protein AOBTE_LOCUS14915 [Acanthoscelides obtectus]
MVKYSLLSMPIRVTLVSGFLRSTKTVHSVKINRLDVPQIAQLGDSVVLDCDYTLEESRDEGLVVKWFFNEHPTPIYQWIPNKRPQEIGDGYCGCPFVAGGLGLSIVEVPPGGSPNADQNVCMSHAHVFPRHVARPHGTHGASGLHGG